MVKELIERDPLYDAEVVQLRDVLAHVVLQRDLAVLGEQQAAAAVNCLEREAV